MKIKIRKAFLAGVTVLWAGVVAQENYAQWTAYRTITVNTTNGGANVAGTVTNFPVPVRLTSAHSDVFSQALANGADIRFTDAAGTVRLKHERERWDAANQAADFWVSVPSIAGNSNTSIRLYWGRSGAADSSNGRAVFDTVNGFQGVFHLLEATSDTVRDATVNGFRGAPGNTGAGAGGSAPVDTQGVIGKGKSFRRIVSGSTAGGSYYQLQGTASGKLNFPEGGPFTLSVWANAYAPNNSSHLVSKDDRQYSLGRRSSGANWEIKDMVAGTGKSYIQTALTNSAWQYLVGVRNGTGSMSLYVNGALASSTVSNDNSSTARYTSLDVYIGRCFDNGTTADASAASNCNYFTGAMDEIVLASSARSADWVKLSYETQKPGATAVTVGVTQNTTVAPAITRHPQSQAVTTGSQVIFTVGATGTAPLTYKWVKNNTDTVAGAATDTLRINSVAGADSGSYKVVVRNGVGQAVSNSATLTVTAGPAITSQPSNATVTMGGTARFGVVATGTPPLTFKWVKNNTDTVGGLDSLTLGNVQGSENGATFKCVVRNAQGQAVSITATLTVLIPPSISQQPLAQSLTVGGTTKFGVVATGTSPLSYRWVKNGTDTVLGAVGDTLTLSSVQFSDSGTYKVVVRNAVGQAVSNAVRLTVVPVAIMTSARQSNGMLKVSSSGSWLVFRFPEGLPDVRVLMTDIWGRTVWSRTLRAGTREFSWSRDYSLATGVYMVRLMEPGRKHRVLAETKFALTP